MAVVIEMTTIIPFTCSFGSQIVQNKDITHFHL